MRLIFILSFFLYSCNARTLKSIEKLDFPPNVTDTVIKNLQNKYDLLLISSSNYSKNFTISQNYYILGLKNKDWYKIEYIKKGIYQKDTKPYSILIEKYSNKNKGDSIMNIFMKNAFWKIKETDEGCEEEGAAEEYENCFRNLKTKKEKMEVSNNCGLGSHPNHKLLIVVTKKGAVQKIYTEPESWEKCLCCPSSRDRKIFIKCYNAINN